MAGKYIGFDSLKGQLAKRPGVTDPAALAASIGRKKYGVKRLQNAAAIGKSLNPQRPRNVPVAGQEGGNLQRTAQAASSGKRITEDDPRWNPRTMGNRRGSKGSKTAPFGNGEYRPT